MTPFQTCALVKRIKDLKKWSAQDFCDAMERGFLSIAREKPSPEQRAAWKGSWPRIRELFTRLPDELYTLFEYRLPASQQRVDLLLLGQNEGGEEIAFVLELKGWRNVQPKSSDHHLVIANGTPHIHPALQTADYIGKLKYTHSEAHRFTWYGAVWLYNLQSTLAVLLTVSNAPEVEIFFGNQTENLATYIKKKMNSGIPEADAGRFLEGTYRQTIQLFQAIRDNAEALRKGALEALAGQGFAPSEEQILLIDRILEAVRNKTSSVFLIDGEPGSGKTYLATLLLIKALSEEKQAVLGFRNNRLINAVRTVFRKVKPGLDGAVKFFSTGRGTGLAETTRQTADFDLIIYDEAQRLAPELAQNAVRRGTVSVFFYDRGQILNVEELESVEAIERTARQSDRSLYQEHLSYVYRVRGGRDYHNFVEALLQNPSEIQKIPNFPDYEFRVFSDIEDLLKALKTKRDLESAHVALVAAFTESPGDRQNKTARSLKNRRIGYPLYSELELYQDKDLDIYWLMDEKMQYPPFWVDRQSNNLTHCASIYGCQGFEADFVGVVWGRDFVLRNGQWTPGAACEDTIGRPSLKDLIRKNDPRALPLLKNRYRIFLTRGIRGTFVFCEDKDAAEFLLKLAQ